MRRVYAGLPSVQVEPLLFSHEDISGERLLAMMKVDEDTREFQAHLTLWPYELSVLLLEMPLYMEAIMSILRSMEEKFDYHEFRRQIAAQRFNGGQKAMLNLRLALLDSCIKDGKATNRIATHFKPGQLTIIE